MFGKLNKEEIEENNQAVEQEAPKSEDKQPIDKKELARDIGGHVLGLAGTVAGIVGGVAASVVLFSSFLSLTGLSMFWAIVVLFGASVLLTFIGNQIAVNNINEIGAAYV